MLLVDAACAQDLEPRSYSNAPVGLNVLVAGYAYAHGKLAFDPALPVADAQFHSNAEAFAYARTLDAWGRAARFDVVLPYTSFGGQALVGGLPRRRDVSGLGDPRFRFTLNLHGAPALSLKEFAAYRQDLIIGASLQVTAPLGQYDNARLINLGNNRWSFKPELGISKTWGAWTLELAPSATFYTRNTDFNIGGTLAQAPLYAVQGHVTYTFSSGTWLAFGGTYFNGGRTTINGVRGNNVQTNSRLGVTLSLPLDRNNSVNFFAASGAWSRTGAEVSAIGAAWQYRWGGGL